MSKIYRECAIEHLKQGNLCKGYVDYIVDEVEKLEKIEQIVERFKSQYDHTTNLDLMVEIKEVLEGE